MPILGCRHCGKLLRYQKPEDLPYFPFCSKQCKLVDLDKWFEEDHRFSDSLLGPDAEAPGAQDDDTEE